MQKIIPSDSRGATAIGWLDSKYSFSFGEYYDPRNMGFGPLRVINEDFVDPAQGFDTHPHKNMELITYVLSGVLEHRDSLGNGSEIRPGDVQLMSAGRGILHSEQNPSPSEKVHLLQIWIMPSEGGTQPGYQQTHFDAAALENQLRLVVSPTGENGSLTIRQDAKLWAGRLAAEKSVSLEIDKRKKYWFQVARGKVTIRDTALAAGDALAIDGETGRVDIRAGADAEVLVFELPQ